MSIFSFLIENHLLIHLLIPFSAIYILIYLSFMGDLLFAGLTSTPAPTAVLVGVASIALFAIVGLMVGPDYDGMNAPEVKK